jgi:hypothetical protein
VVHYFFNFFVGGGVFAGTHHISKLHIRDHSALLVFPHIRCALGIHMTQSSSSNTNDFISDKNVVTPLDLKGVRLIIDRGVVSQSGNTNGCISHHHCQHFNVCIWSLYLSGAVIFYQVSVSFTGYSEIVGH